MKIDYKGASTCALAVSLFEVVMTLVRMYPLRQTLMEGGTLLSLLLTIVSFAAFAGALWYYKKNYNVDTFTYTNGLKVGMVMGIFYAVILAAMQFCIMTFDTQYVNELVELQKKTLAMSGLSAEQAQMAMKSTTWVFSPWYMAISALIGSWISCLFYSLIAMIFLKENEDYKGAMKDVEESFDDNK